MIKTKEEYLKELNVLYEDNHLLIVEKFKDVLSQKDETNDLDMTEIIKEYIKVKYNKPGNVYLGLIHRLDRRVGGVMVFAKTSKSASRLSEDIRNHDFEKYYLVKVKGTITKDGSINIKLLKDEKTRLAIVDNKGKDSILNYKVYKNEIDYTYLIVELITGRYNQIRASFAHIGYPIVNDFKYDKTIKANKDDLGLWCYKISLNHPVTKEKLTIELMPLGNMWNIK